MTDTFLEDNEVRLFTAACETVAVGSTALLRIARRETSPPGGRTERRPDGYASTPPLNIGALSVAHEMSGCLTGWADNLHADTAIPMPERRDDTGLAMYLGYHAHRVAQQTWARECAEEIAHWAHVVQTITDPPALKRRDDYTTAQRHEVMTHAKVDAPLCAELVAEWTDGEHTPTPDQIRTWASRLHVTRFGQEKGKGTYSPREVIAHMRGRKARVA